LTSLTLFLQNPNDTANNEKEKKGYMKETIEVLVSSHYQQILGEFVTTVMILSVKYHTEHLLFEQSYGICSAS